MNLKVLDFGFFSPEDRFDKNYFDGHAWSRPYEYQYVLHKILSLNASYTELYPSIHNTSWGFEGIHVKFKEEIDGLFTKNTLHTDIKPSDLKNTSVYDITKRPPEEYIEKFDYVINISTLEEVNFYQSVIFDNLISQVKIGGYLIITFDYPGLELGNFESILGIKIKDSGTRLNPRNSVVVNNSLSGNLNVGYLTIKKL